MRCITFPADQCAPCHLLDIDPQIVPQLATIPADLPCNGCGLPDREADMLLCDGCNAGWHYDCLDPPLGRVPDAEYWFCKRCIEEGRAVPPAAPVSAEQPRRANRDAYFPNAAPG